MWATQQMKSFRLFFAAWCNPNESDSSSYSIDFTFPERMDYHTVIGYKNA